jgi:hypothetical protein
VTPDPAIGPPFISEHLYDGRPTRCPKCGGPLEQVGNATLPLACRVCRLNIVMRIEPTDARRKDGRMNTDPPIDCADLLGCHKCGSDRVETFRVDRVIFLACADCGAHETETTSDR